MGIFSHFGKKDQTPSTRDRATSHGKSGAPDAGNDFGDTLAPLTGTSAQSREAARTTALKIDAIESAMTSEFVNSAMVNHASAGADASPRATAPNAAGNADARAPHTDVAATIPLQDFDATVEGPVPAASRADMAKPDITSIASTPPPAVITTPAIEEAAILFANGQPAVAEQILQSALQDPTAGPATSVLWRMLFELYQLTGRREQFDALSIDFASTFETSPPAWQDALVSNNDAPGKQKPSTVPSVVFAGKLDAQVSKQLTRAQSLAAHHPALRLEFTNASSIDPVACGLLLRLLKKLQKAELELVLVGAPVLADKIRAILQVGRRDETEAPWLLLLEILRLLNLEQEFEDSSIDYCVTFEVSPPAFVAPKTRVSTAAAVAAAPAADEAAADVFTMPPLVAGDMPSLIAAITQYAAGHDPVMLDCRHMARLDFSAAGQLVSGLAPLLDKTIELHDVNHLVVPLLYALDLQHVVSIFPRRN